MPRIDAKVHAITLLSLAIAVGEKIVPKPSRALAQLWMLLDVLLENRKDT